MTTPEPPVPPTVFALPPKLKGQLSPAPPPPPKLAVPFPPPTQLSVLLLAPAPAFVPPALSEPPPSAPYVAEAPENVDVVPVPAPEPVREPVAPPVALTIVVAP